MLQIQIKLNHSIKDSSKPIKSFNQRANIYIQLNTKKEKKGAHGDARRCQQGTLLFWWHLQIFFHIGSTFHIFHPMTLKQNKHSLYLLHKTI